MLLEFVTERNSYIPQDSLSDVLATSSARNELIGTSVIRPSESDQFPDYSTDIFSKLNKWFQANKLLNIDKNKVKLLITKQVSVEIQVMVIKPLKNW
jgi:hypothetical protein